MRCTWPWPSWPSPTGRCTHRTQPVPSSTGRPYSAGAPGCPRIDILARAPCAWLSAPPYTAVSRLRGARLACASHVLAPLDLPNFCDDPPLYKWGIPLRANQCFMRLCLLPVFCDDPPHSPVRDGAHICAAWCANQALTPLRANDKQNTAEILFQVEVMMARNVLSTRRRTGGPQRWIYGSPH